MAEYVVTWSIEIDADTPQQAANEAYQTMLDPESLATVFVVTQDEPFWPGRHLTWTVDVGNGEVRAENG